MKQLETVRRFCLMHCIYHRAKRGPRNWQKSCILSAGFAFPAIKQNKRFCSCFSLFYRTYASAVTLKSLGFTLNLTRQLAFCQHASAVVILRLYHVPVNKHHARHGLRHFLSHAIVQFHWHQTTQKGANELRWNFLTQWGVAHLRPSDYR